MDPRTAAEFEIYVTPSCHVSRQPIPNPSLARRVSVATTLTTLAMSSKRKWDQAAPDALADSEVPIKATKTDEGKSASEAAAAAAAIAAKIAAQFSAGGSAPGSIQIGQRDPHDAEFTHDIDINDVRNRYMLTKGSTQAEVCFFLTLGVVINGEVGTDKRGDGCIGEHQGRLVPGSIQGDGEGSPSIPPPLRILKRYPPKSHRQDQRPNLRGPWTTGRRQKRPTARKGRPGHSYALLAWLTIV